METPEGQQAKLEAEAGGGEPWLGALVGLKEPVLTNYISPSQP